MKSLKSLLLELEGQPPVPNPALGPQIGNEPAQNIELPGLNLIVSVAEKEKKMTFSPADPTKITSKARTFIDGMKQKFKITSVQQKINNVFIVTFDPRQDISLVIAYLEENGAV